VKVGRTLRLQKLDIVPAKIQVIRHIRPKYACRACEGVEADGPTVKTVPMPPQIIPQGETTAQFFEVPEFHLSVLFRA